MLLWHARGLVLSVSVCVATSEPRQATRACHPPVVPGAWLCLSRSLPHLSPRRRSQRGARAAQRARTTLTPTSGDARSATRKAPAAHPRSTGPLRTPRKPSRNGYKPPTRRSSPKPIPQKEDPGFNPSGHPHSCRKTHKTDAILLGVVEDVLGAA